MEIAACGLFGGGGGVIVPAEIQELQASGVSRIYSPEDGQRMGLAGMIGEMLMMSDCDLSQHAPQQISAIRGRGGGLTPLPVDPSTILIPISNATPLSPKIAIGGTGANSGP